MNKKEVDMQDQRYWSWDGWMHEIKNIVGDMQRKMKEVANEVEDDKSEKHKIWNIWKPF